MTKPDARERALALLGRFGLADKAGAHPDALSGGQQQRAAVVRALCTEPRLLLLDEITAALDPELVGEVLEIVRAEAEAGMTMLLATHEMAFAREVATSVCFLDQGRILEQGPPDEIFSAPREARTREFLRRVLPDWRGDPRVRPDALPGSGSRTILSLTVPALSDCHDVVTDPRGR